MAKRFRGLCKNVELQRCLEIESILTPLVVWLVPCVSEEKEKRWWSSKERVKRSQMKRERRKARGRVRE